MSTAIMIEANDINHYILQTPGRFLHNYNAREDVSEPISIFAFRTFVLFQNQVLQTSHRTGVWIAPRYIFDNLNTSCSIADFCYTFLDATGIQFRELQIMEPAFEEYLLEPLLTTANMGRRILTLCILLTTTALPYYTPEPEKLRMIPLPELIETVPSDFWPCIESTLSRVQNFSPANLLQRFPDRQEFLRLRMTFLLDFLEGWKSNQRSLRRFGNQGDANPDFYIVIFQKSSSQEGKESSSSSSSPTKEPGLFLLETSERVFQRLLDDPARRPILETDAWFELVGVSFRRRRDGEAGSQLFSFDRDREDVFDQIGRLRAQWIVGDQAQRLEGLVMTGGYRSFV